MPIKHHPDPGEALWCEYAGIEPEMTKRRFCVVVTPRSCQRSGITTVVPISATAPDVIKPWHVLLTRDPMPGGTAQEVWAKCDMISAVSFDRLSRHHRRWNGKREYQTVRLLPDDFVAIRVGIAAALGLSVS